MRMVIPLRLGARLLLRQTTSTGQLAACCVLAQPSPVCCTPHAHQPMKQQTINYCSASKATGVKPKPRVPVPDQYKNMEFTVFYRFHSIRGMRILSRMKLYQTAAAVFGVPPLGFMYSTGAVSGSVFGSYCAIASFAGVMLYVMSYYMRRLIGMMSLSDCGKIVRVSHLTFWGKRNDVYIAVDKLVPLSELPEKLTDVYIALRRYDVEDILFFTLRWGLIVDSEKFYTAFGSMETR